ncbi:hypothetical protein BDV3_006320 [Batrachochytrium dendrobatidis]
MTSSLPTLKLTYFPFRAKGEASRLALHIGGISFEDDRVSRQAFVAIKPLQPFSQIPVLTINKTIQIAQSIGIVKYTGILAGLYPTDCLLKAALVDQVILHMEDMGNLLYDTMSRPDTETVMQERRDIVQVKYPLMFEKLEQVLAQHSGGKWAVGDSITIADLSIYVMIAMAKEDMWVGVPDNIGDPFSRIMGVYQAVLEHPKVVEWEAIPRQLFHH